MKMRTFVISAAVFLFVLGFTVLLSVTDGFYGTQSSNSVGMGVFALIIGPGLFVVVLIGLFVLLIWYLNKRKMEQYRLPPPPPGAWQDVHGAWHNPPHPGLWLEEQYRYMESPRWPQQ